MGHRVVEIKTRCESGRIGNLLKSNTFGFFDYTGSNRLTRRSPLWLVSN